MAINPLCLRCEIPTRQSQGPVVTYRVIRTIKGRQYVYEQTSVRDGNKVRTMSRYIGPVDPIQQTARQKVVQTLADVSGTKERVQEAIVPDAEVLTKPSDEPLEPPPRPPPASESAPSLRIKINAAKFISEARLQKDFQKAVSSLRRAGVSTAKFPDITLKYGSSIGYHKKAFSDAYVVKLPRWIKPKREEFRTACHKAISRACLDQIITQRPDLLKDIAYRFDESFKATQDILNRYLLWSEGSSNFNSLLILKFFGTMPKLRYVKPETIGLVEFGKRKTWEDEFVSVHANIIKRGFGQATENAKAEYFKAVAAEKSAGNELRETFILFRPRVKRKLKRAIARKQAQYEMMNKIALVRSLFDTKQGKTG